MSSCEWSIHFSAALQIELNISYSWAGMRERYTKVMWLEVRFTGLGEAQAGRACGWQCEWHTLFSGKPALPSTRVESAQWTGMQRSALGDSHSTVLLPSCHLPATAEKEGSTLLLVQQVLQPQASS